MNRPAVILAALVAAGAVAALSSRRGILGAGGGPPPSKPGQRDLVLWAGPVNKAQVPGATVLGAIEHFIPCTGNGSPSCGQIAESWTDGDGRKLPALLAQLGLTEAAVGNIYLGAFSAGGSTLRRLLMHPADREKIRGVMLADATYSSPSLKPIEGFVRYGLDALKGGRMFVATASASPNKTYGSGAEVLDATRREIEARSGVSFAEGGTLPITQQPDRLLTAPGIIFADYGWQGGGHRLHPKLAPELWQNVLQPWVVS